MADNVDHNIHSLDSRGSFHGMGIIAASTCVTDDVQFSRQQIPRLLSRCNAGDVVRGGEVAITPYNGVAKSGLKDVRMQPAYTLQQPLTYPDISNLNILWQHIGWFLQSQNSPRPNWSGFMQRCCHGAHSHSAVASLQFLPCVTFEMPFRLKAVKVVASSGMSIVCRLGPFHTMMSYIGAIGRIMESSGLEKMLQLNYGADTVGNITLGRAVARAVRGHLLINDALTIKLQQAVYQELSLEDAP